jgi:hypothetical protein
MACINCSDELHWECTNVTDGACCCHNTSPLVAEIIEDEEDTRNIRGYKRDSTLKDQQSTGRKRAAVMYPLDSTAPCEWQGLRFAGGGRNPIIGCNNGTQQARHHGPDKNTLNNDKGNVHRICATCHNRWHTLNDSEYQPEDSRFSHDASTRATIEDLVSNVQFWANRKLVKAKD